MGVNTLRIGLEKVDFRLPTQVTDDSSVLTLKNLVFEPLLKWQPGGLVHPALFDHWEQSSDGREWHFYIRKDAIFHDGEVCAANHIIAFIKAILESRDTFGMKWSYYRYLAHAKITAEDEQTVKVVNPEPFADILDIFTEFYICRVTPDEKPILGTGPYRVVEFDTVGGGRAVLEAMKLRDAKVQRAQRIIVTAEPSAEKRLSKLRQGIIDVALNLERLDGVLNFDQDLHWGTSTTTLSVIFYLNCREGIFASTDARLAVNHAIDTEALSAEVFNNLAVPSATAVSPFHLGATGEAAKLEPIPYDLAKARRLLQGVNTNTPIVLRTPTFMPERAEAITRFVVKSLEAVGIKVVVEIEADRSIYARQVGLDKNIGDLALFDSSPHSTYRVLNDKVSSTTRAVWWQGYQDAEVDRLIKVANNAVEDNDRRHKYMQVLERLRKNPPWLYLVHPIEVFGARLGVEGLRLDCKGVLNIDLDT